MALHLLVLIALLATQLLGIASSIGTIIPLRLTKGESVEVSVFRLSPTPLHFRLDFNKQKGTIRPELGGIKHTDPNGGKIRFDSPGEAIKILAASELGRQVYEMFPGGYLAFEKDDSTAKRIFEPFVEDDDPAAYPWPPANHLRPTLPAGFSTLKFSVVQAGTITANEQVKIYIAPPLDVKTVQTSDYLWLGWATILLPWNLFALAMYGWYLLKKARRLASNK
ncbi:hypothetical protein LZ012_14070 [Dechloromonas sp. XY25]|uniref:Protein PBN1 n=1 Tax=Dechloromonas hankyongensis TaxID=2908002 RepID=A0ABS9K4M5_9RHOO|nr:hypothetical protein [Dechloromonas hankyongensis]MCG2578117.1 hypothetical protein [Dechloromonas hankyongensis]